MAPALAAGNCVIGKPSEVTPWTACLLGELAREAGFPDGVLNIVHGRGPAIGRALVEHPEVKAVSFTGSTRAGADIAARVAPRFKKLSLELGGKNPTVIFADAVPEPLTRVVRAARAYREFATDEPLAELVNPCQFSLDDFFHGGLHVGQNHAFLQNDLRGDDQRRIDRLSNLAT